MKFIILAVAVVGCVYFVPQLFSKNEKLNYYKFSEHRSFLMGVAAIFITVFHSVYYNDLSSDNQIISGMINSLYQLNIGVEMFLLLSGIGMYFAFNNKKVKFMQYYFKRVINVYLIALIVDLPFFIYADFFYEKKSVLSFFMDWLRLSNWIGTTKIGWYAFFAMVLYAIYPIMFKILKKIEDSKYILPMLVVLCVGMAIFCKAVSHFVPKIYEVVEIAITRMPIFFIGCYMGKLVYNKEQSTRKLTIFSILGIVIWVVLVGFVGGIMQDRLSHCLLSIAVCVALINFADLIKKSNPIYKIFEFLGGMSLEIYLVHIALAKAIFDYNDVNSLLWYYVMIGCSIAISYPLSQFRKFMVKKYIDSIKIKQIEG